MSDSTSLSEDQILFLSNRPNYATDAECARQLGLSVRTPNMWKHKILRDSSGEKLYDDDGNAIKPFALAYNEVMSAARAVIENPIEFVAEVLLPKAGARKNEILNIRITPQTPAAMVSAINNAADSIMKGSGLMTPDNENNLRVTVVVADAIKAGAEYQAPWMSASSPVPQPDPVKRLVDDGDQAPSPDLNSPPQPDSLSEHNSSEFLD